MLCIDGVRWGLFEGECGAELSKDVIQHASYRHDEEVAVEAAEVVGKIIEHLATIPNISIYVIIAETLSKAV